MTRPNRSLEAAVIRRARGRCEDCHFPEAASELPFHLDHIVAEKHRGPTTSANLAWACFSCNLCKGPNVAGMDPLTGKLTRLFIHGVTSGQSISIGTASGCVGKRPLAGPRLPCSQ